MCRVTCSALLRAHDVYAHCSSLLAATSLALSHSRPAYTHCVSHGSLVPWDMDVLREREREVDGSSEGMAIGLGSRDVPGLALHCVFVSNGDTLLRM